MYNISWLMLNGEKKLYVASYSANTTVSSNRMPPKKKSLITIENAIEWFTLNRYLYKQLANKVNIILAELLEINGIRVHAIFNRAKDIESFKEKIKDPKYTNPQEQITDLAGIRI